MTLLNKIFTYLLVLVIGVFIGSTQQCGGKLKQGKTDTTSVVSYIKGDTKTIVQEKKMPYPVYKHKTDTVWIKYNLCDSVRGYVDNFKIDSNQSISYTDTIIGKKLSGKFVYTGAPITKVVSTTITRTDTLFAEKKKAHLFIGGEAGGNLNRFDYSIGAHLTTKKNLIIGYRYGVNTKTHNIGIGVKIF